MIDFVMQSINIDCLSTPDLASQHAKLSVVLNCELLM